MSVPTSADTGDTPTDADLFALIGGERPAAPILIPSHDDTPVDPALVLLKGWAAMDAPKLATPRKMTLQQMRDSLISANASLITGPNKPLPTREGVEVALLEQDLRLALAARGDRKAMRRPHRARRRRSLFDVVNLHLRRLSTRALNDRHLRGETTPTIETLAEALESYVRADLRALILGFEPGEQPHPHRVRRTYLDESRSGMGAVRAVAMSAATYSVLSWSAQWIEQRQRWGAKGGRISKRTKTWGDSDLDRLAELGHLTITEQATELGRGASTVKRMRKALQDRLEAALGDDDVQSTPCIPPRRPGRLRAVRRLALHHRPVPDHRPRRHRGDPHGQLHPEHHHRGLAPRAQSGRRSKKSPPSHLERRRPRRPRPARGPHRRRTGRDAGTVPIDDRQDETRPPRSHSRPELRPTTRPGYALRRTITTRMPTCLCRGSRHDRTSSSTGPPRAPVRGVRSRP